MVYRSFQEQARTTTPSGVSGIGQVVQPGEILAEEDMQFKFQPPQEQQSTLGKIGSVIAAVDKPISERAGFKIPEAPGPIDEIGNFILREGSRPSNLLFALPGVGWGAKGIATASRAASKAGQLAKLGGRTPTLGRVVERVAQPLGRFGVGATEPFGTFAGKLPYKLGMETGTNIVTAGLGRSAMDALPEDAHWSVKLGAGLGTALLAGGIAARTGAYLPTKFPGLIDQRKLGRIWSERQIAARTGLGIPMQSLAEWEAGVRNLPDQVLAEGYRFDLDTWGDPKLVEPDAIQKTVLDVVDRPSFLFEDEQLRSPFLSGVDASAARSGELPKYQQLKNQANEAVNRSQKNLADFIENIENTGGTDIFSQKVAEAELNPIEDTPNWKIIEDILNEESPESLEWIEGMKRLLIERGEPEIKADTYLEEYVEASRFLEDFNELESGLLKPRADDAFKVNNLDGKRVSIWDKSITSNLDNKKINAAVTEVIRNNPDQFNISQTLPLPLTGRGAANPYSDSNKAIAKYLEMDESAPELEVQRLSSEDAYDTMTDTDILELTPGSAIAGKGYLENLKALNKFLRSRKETQEFDLGRAQLRFPDPEDQVRLTADNPNTLDAIRKSPSKAFFDNAGNVLRIYKRQENRTRFADIEARTAKGNIPRSQSAKIDDVSIRITDPALREFLSNLYAGIKSGDAQENAADLIMRDIDTYENLSPVAKQLLDVSDAGRPTKKKYLETLRTAAESKEIVKKDLPDTDLGAFARQQSIQKSLEEDLGIRKQDVKQATNVLNAFLGTPKNEDFSGQWLQSEEGGIALKVSDSGHLDDLRMLEPEVLVDGPDAFAARQLEKQQLLEEGEIKPHQTLPDDRWGITTRGVAGQAIVDAIENHNLKTVAVMDGGPMSAFFQDAGFQEIGRIQFENAGVRADFDTDMFGRPDVIMMAYTGGPRKGRILDSGRIRGGAASRFGEYGGYEGTRNRFENISKAQQVGGLISDLSEKYGGKRFNDLYNDPEAAEEFASLSREVGPIFDELENARLVEAINTNEVFDVESLSRPEFTAPIPEAKPNLSKDMQTFISRNRGAVRQSGAKKNAILTLSKIEKDPRNKSQFRKIPINYVLDPDSGNLISEDLWIELGEQLNSWGRLMGKGKNTAAKALAIERQRAQNDWDATQPPEDPSLLDRLLSTVLRGRFNPQAATIALDYTSGKQQVKNSVGRQRELWDYEFPKSNLQKSADLTTGDFDKDLGLIQVRQYTDFAGVKHEGPMVYVPSGNVIRKSVVIPDTGDTVEAVIFDARSADVWGEKAVNDWIEIVEPIERLRYAEEVQLDDAGRSVTQFDFVDAAAEQRRVGEGINESGWIPLGDFLENSNMFRTPDGRTLLGGYGIGRQFQFTQTLDLANLPRGDAQKTQYQERTGRQSPGLRPQELQFNITELAENNQSLSFINSVPDMLALRYRAGLDSLNGQIFKDNVRKIGRTAFEQLDIANPGLQKQYNAILGKMTRAMDPDKRLTEESERAVIEEMAKYSDKILNRIENELTRMVKDNNFARFPARELQENMREINDAMGDFGKLNRDVGQLVLEGRAVRGNLKTAENQLRSTGASIGDTQGSILGGADIQNDFMNNPGRKAWLENEQNYIRAIGWDKFLQKLDAEIKKEYIKLTKEFARYGLALPETVQRPTNIDELGRSEVDRATRAAQRNFQGQVEDIMFKEGFTEDSWPLRLPVAKRLTQRTAPYYVTDDLIIETLTEEFSTAPYFATRDNPQNFYKDIKEFFRTTSSPRFLALQDKTTRAHVEWGDPALIRLVLDGMLRNKIDRDAMKAFLENPKQADAVARFQMKLLAKSQAANKGAGIKGIDAFPTSELDRIGALINPNPIETNQSIRQGFLNLNKLYIQAMKKYNEVNQGFGEIQQKNADINIEETRSAANAAESEAIQKMLDRSAMEYSNGEYDTKIKLVRYAKRMFSSAGAYEKYINNANQKVNDRMVKRLEAAVEAQKELIDVKEQINKFVTRFNNQLGVEQLERLAPMMPGATRVMPDVAREFAATPGLKAPSQPSGALKMFADLNAEMRQISATLDFSGTGIQGVFAAGAHPIEFARSWWMVTKSVVRDDDSWYQWMESNKDLIDEFLELGGVWTHPGGQEEFLLQPNTPVIKALGSVAERNNITKNIGKTLGKGRDMSNIHFSRIGNANRMLMFKKWREGKGIYKLLKGKEMPASQQADVVKMINASTGYADNYQPGTIAQAALFAPRFFKSQLEMLSGAAFRNDSSGQLARSLMLTTIMTGAVIVESLNSIRSEETDWRPMKFSKQGTPYWNTNFMRIRNIGGRDISLFGPYDSLAGLLVTGVAEGPESMFFKGMRQKASPMMQRLYDSIQGSDFYGNKVTFNMLNDTTGTISTVRNMAQNSYTPFYVSDVTEDIVEGRTSVGSIPLAMGAFLGLKTSPLSMSEMQQKDVLEWVDNLEPEEKMELGLIYEDNGTFSEVEITEYSDLTGAARSLFDQQFPNNRQELTENLQRLADSGDVNAISRLNKMMINETAERDQEKLAEAFLRWRGNIPDPNLGYVVPIDISKVLAELTNIRYRSWKARKTQDEFFETEITNTTSDDPNTQALSAYWNALDSSSVPGTNEVVWPEFNRKIGELYKQLSPEQISIIENRSPAKIHPVFQPYWDARQRVNESTYYAIGDDIYQRPQVQNAIAAVIGIDNTPPYYELFSTMVEDLRADPDPQRQQVGVLLGRIINKLTPLITDQRKQLLIADANSGGRLREDLELIGRIRPQVQTMNTYNPSFGPSMVTASN